MPSKGVNHIDKQLQSTFPQVKHRQLCHYHENGGYTKAYVSCVFDGGFEITKHDGTVVRFLEAKWDQGDVQSLFWLTRNGKPIKRSWFRR